MQSFFIDFFSTLARFLIDFGWKLKSREAQIMCKNHRFFKIFVISSNLLKRGHMIDILVNMAPNMDPETFPKSFPKRTKSTRNRCQHRSKFCMLFEWPFSGSWRPTWLQKPSKTEPGGIGKLLLFLGLEGSWEGLGASWGPRADFNSFLVDF